MFELAEKEKLRVRNVQRKMISFKDEVIQNLSREVAILKSSLNSGSNTLNFIDLPEDVLEDIFSYISNDELVWSVGQTCQQLMEYVLRYVWVIPDSVRTPMIGEKRNTLIDLSLIHI